MDLKFCFEKAQSKAQICPACLNYKRKIQFTFLFKKLGQNHMWVSLSRLENLAAADPILWRLSITKKALSHCRSFTKVARHHLLYNLPKISNLNSLHSWSILVWTVQQSRHYSTTISKALSFICFSTFITVLYFFAPNFLIGAFLLRNYCAIYILCTFV